MCHSLPVHQSMTVPWDFTCPILSAKPVYTISSHNCHRNVSLPSGASLWNGMFGRVEGQYTTLKPDCHCWWISKIQSGHEDTLEEWYAIKFCFKLGKNATETYGMLQTAFRPSCMNWASVFEWHKRFKEGRESLRVDERCGRSKQVNTTLLIGQTVRVTMLRF